MSPNERIAVESHVSICADCAREMAETRTLQEGLSILREGEMPAGAAERIWRGVQSAVPGRRRALAIEWSLRAAAVLVMGLAIGFTTSSVVSRPVENSAAENAPLEDARPTFVPKSFLAPVTPRARSLHHLPYVDAILEQDVVRF